ncbi:hypothetical protein H920_02181 [Fukomys damarensis]|uniref:Uncharacterized protein n=1 Tax=Fukomys damarensis TaxID=885580 RepID=A0A091DZB8_FUKDA|nr:hypothetical protein H920_02181 [Fukomys damarensis]
MSCGERPPPATNRERECAEPDELPPSSDHVLEFTEHRRYDKAVAAKTQDHGIITVSDWHTRVKGEEFIDITPTTTGIVRATGKVSSSLQPASVGSKERGGQERGPLGNDMISTAETTNDIKSKEQIECRKGGRDQQHPSCREVKPSALSKWQSNRQEMS